MYSASPHLAADAKVPAYITLLDMSSQPQKSQASPVICIHFYWSPIHKGESLKISGVSWNREGQWHSEYKIKSVLVTYFFFQKQMSGEALSIIGSQPSTLRFTIPSLWLRKWHDGSHDSRRERMR